MRGNKFHLRLNWLWCFVPALVVIEIVSQWRIERSAPDPQDWISAAQAIQKEKKDGDLVIIASTWATQGRMYLKDLISLKDFGRFDTTTYDRIFEVSVNGARSFETYSLTKENEQTFRRIAVRRYALSPRAEVIYDFVSNAGSAVVSNGKSSTPLFVIDHWFFPRLVIPVTLKKRGVSITFGDIPLSGNVLRGYGIVSYRSGRFNQGGPIAVAVYLNGAFIGKHIVENFGPKGPFEFNLPKGLDRGEVRFEINAKDGLDREFGFSADIRKAKAQ